jgi:UDP-N-acetylglucosamine 2-epimerase (non-hydrolysing)
LYKIAIILGTRPGAIKLAPVILALKGHPAFDCRLCVTGQHRQLLDQALEAFGLVPDTDLNLMRPNQTLAGLTARCIEAIDGFLARETPDLTLVQGDTNTALCGTLASFYRRIAVGHVEAGLRTGHLGSPWPEEGNRAMISRLALLHFAPTAAARDNLLAEAVAPSHIFVTGNTVIDALGLALERVRVSPPTIPDLPDAFWRGPGTMSLVLITAHRRESLGAELESICRAVLELARRFPETQFVYPLHLNPHVRNHVHETVGPTKPGNLHLIEPIPYLSFVALMNRAKLILTDSGGIQEEAPSLGKPVLVMRDTTERTEALETGKVKLVGTSYRAIVDETSRLLTNSPAHEAHAPVRNPYGDGKAASRIVETCHSWLTTYSKQPGGLWGCHGTGAMGGLAR